MAKAQKKAAPPAEGFVAIVAHRNLEVDGVAIAEGETGEIRAELLDGLVAIGAASLVEDMG
jgi:hypothetical protein